jgi:hypothetical protein
MTLTVDEQRVVTNSLWTEGPHPACCVSFRNGRPNFPIPGVRAAWRLRRMMLNLLGPKGKG